jgi:hypothetical protein
MRNQNRSSIAKRTEGAYVLLADFVARSHGSTGVKPNGGLPCVGTAEVH